MQDSSLFDKVNEGEKEKLLGLLSLERREGVLLRRCAGSMMGMVMADALGKLFWLFLVVVVFCCCVLFFKLLSFGGLKYYF